MLIYYTGFNKSYLLIILMTKKNLPFQINQSAPGQVVPITEALDGFRSGRLECCWYLIQRSKLFSIIVFCPLGDWKNM